MVSFIPSFFFWQILIYLLISKYRNRQGTLKIKKPARLAILEYCRFALILMLSNVAVLSSIRFREDFKKAFTMLSSNDLLPLKLWIFQTHVAWVSVCPTSSFTLYQFTCPPDYWNVYFRLNGAFFFCPETWVFALNLSWSLNVHVKTKQSKTKKKRKRKRCIQNIISVDQTSRPCSPGSPTSPLAPSGP